MLWNGPYKILKVSKSGQRILVKEGERNEWHNIKNIKPFKGE